jgi:hypothetical protein
MTTRPYLLAGTMLLMAYACHSKIPDHKDQLICIKGTFSLRIVLHKIESQTGKRFFYANSDFDDQQLVTVNWHHRPLSEVLGTLQKTKRLHWDEKGKIVALSLER